ncbi:hypothetical protein JCM3774_003757 [Rhodotorula dairenensis]
MQPKSLSAMSAKGKGREPVNAASLLSLSDEILTRIYNHVAAEHWDAGDSKGIPPVTHLLVCKRLYELLLPIWYSYIDGPSEKDRSDAYYGRLALSGSVVTGAVQQLRLKLRPAGCTHVYSLCATLAHFRRLEILRIPDLLGGDDSELDIQNGGGAGAIEPGAAPHVLPLPILRVCEQLTRLRCLDLFHDYDLPADPVDKLPKPAALTEMEMNGLSLRPRMSSYLVRLGVKRLFLLFETTVLVEIAKLPWTTLQALTLAFGGEADAEDEKKVIEALNRQLTEVTIDQHVLQELCSFERYKFLRHAPLKRLRLSLHDDCHALRYPAFGWDTLTYLYVVAFIDLRVGTALHDLLTFVRRSPNLATVELDGAVLLSDHREGDLDSAFSDELLPHLGVLLAALRQTALTTFCLRQRTPTPPLKDFGKKRYKARVLRVLRWTRREADPKEKFSRELIWDLREVVPRAGF